MGTRKLPQFENEEAEARWLFEHREELAEDLVTAIREGSAGDGSHRRRARSLTDAQRELVASEHSTPTAPAK